MKKWLIIAAVFVLAVVIGVTIFVVVKFASLDKTAETTVAPAAPEAYAKKHYPEYDITYMPEQKLLILEKKRDFSLDRAPGIYTDDSIYITQVRILAVDILAACDDPEIEVVLRYLSENGEPMYAVSSTGEITRYWEQEKAA